MDLTDIIGMILIALIIAISMHMVLKRISTNNRKNKLIQPIQPVNSNYYTNNNNNNINNNNNNNNISVSVPTLPINNNNNSDSNGKTIIQNTFHESDNDVDLTFIQDVTDKNIIDFNAIDKNNNNKINNFFEEYLYNGRNKYHDVNNINENDINSFKDNYFNFKDSIWQQGDNNMEQLNKVNMLHELSNLAGSNMDINGMKIKDIYDKITAGPNVDPMYKQLDHFVDENNVRIYNNEIVSNGGEYFDGVYGYNDNDAVTDNGSVL